MQWSPTKPWTTVLEPAGLLFVLASCVKLALLTLDGYRSTDFEVHRNWFALTYSLPYSLWYLDTTSEWTLDYPPFFAYFSRAIATLAALVDDDLVKFGPAQVPILANKKTVVFMRLSVIASDATLLIALYIFFWKRSKSHVAILTSALVLFNPGLLIVDHIHFQYNGFLLGLLLLSIALVKRENFILSGIIFATLLNFKHLYLTLSPAYFMHFCMSYCCKGSIRRFLKRFTALGLSLFVVFSISYAPFYDSLLNVIQRLFPFKRGLCHSQWAPNVWALYTTLDRLLIKFYNAQKYPLESKYNDYSILESPTRGIVGDTNFYVLPAITPLHTMIICMILALVALIRAKYRPTWRALVSTLIDCAFASFLFGWHVHEKAILTILVPMSLLIRKSSHATSQVFFVFSIISQHALLPLLYPIEETLLSWCISGCWAVVSWKSLGNFHGKSLSYNMPIFVKIYLIFIPFLEFYRVFGHKLLFSDGSMEFLPLMLNSCYCSVGIISTWLYILFISTII